MQSHQVNFPHVAKKSERQASRCHQVPRQTLTRYLAKVRNSAEVMKSPLARSPVLTTGQEEQMGKLIMNMESMMYGLTLIGV